MNIKELRETTGMTQKDFGEYLNIPHRTIQNWESEHRTPPEYVTELIEYKLKKEKTNMKKELNILRSKEDGGLTLAYKGVDLNDYDYITIEEFIEEVENTNTWDEIEPEIYTKALEDMGLDYSSYNDPDEMWEDFLKKVRD